MQRKDKRKETIFLESRRRFLLLSILALGGALTAKYFPSLFKEYSNGLTPIDEIYVVQIGGTPDINLDEWRLEITGEVENPLLLTYEDLIKMPATQVVETLECVSDPTFLRANIIWTGIKLSYLLQQAKVKPTAVKLIFYGADGYVSDLPLKYLNDQMIVAYLLDGMKIPKVHGFPARVVIPGWWGYKHVKWVTKIEVSNDPNFLGYWESLGYPDIAIIPNYKPPELDNNG